MYKLLIGCLMLLIVFNLFRALFFLVKDQGTTSRTANSLKWRVIYSIALVLALVYGYFSGDLTPHSLPKVQEEAMSEASKNGD